MTIMTRKKLRGEEEGWLVGSYWLPIAGFSAGVDACKEFVGYPTLSGL
jgi:hypothetical protein